MRPIIILFVFAIFCACSKEPYFDASIHINENEVMTSELQDVQFVIENDASFEENILLLVDEAVLVDIKPKLKRLIKDMNTNSQNVYVELKNDMSFVSIRELIFTYYEENKIQGSIFIGNIPIPHARFKSPVGVDYTGVSPLYYMDLDGEFEFDEADIIIDQKGNRSIEIWVSVIPAYGQNAHDHINDYLDKNHKYRSGLMDMEKGFVNPLIGAQINSVEKYNKQYEYLINETYQELNRRGNLLLGIDNKLNDVERFPDAKHVYETMLLSSKFDVAKIGAHGSSTFFGTFDEWGSIVIDVDYAKSTPIQPMLLIETSCNTAAIDKKINLACEFLFNPENHVVTYSGATAPQGGKGMTEHGSPTNYVAKKMTSGALLGESLLAPMYHEYTQGLYREFRAYFSAQQIVLGDGSLKLQEFMN